VDEDHAGRVELEEVVDERDRHDDGRGRSGEGEPGETFDEGGDEGCREMARRRGRKGRKRVSLPA
jgi:hypothetical protein